MDDYHLWSPDFYIYVVGEYLSNFGIIIGKLITIKYIENNTIIFQEEVGLQKKIVEEENLPEIF